ncbi:Alpha/Beta hydrolase protein [Multifurca ochricompacta]|uniref:Alpha/Beta hydrolase protein n=1 Tax=Multifurca ochricompacta TaxID=376703 RepID=A0AAD4QUK1_9AGAM|nr:Alpha/Beta hydrolase protein [Multifurca ochricompacta]
MNSHIYPSSSSNIPRYRYPFEQDTQPSTNMVSGARSHPLGIKLRPGPMNPQDMPARPPTSQKSPHKPPHPVVRWYGQTNLSTTSIHLQSPDSPPLSRSASPIQNLLDALTSPLLSPPTLPLSVHQRLALPTASISNLAPATRPFDPLEDSQSPGAPIFLQYSPPERSSLDALRSLRIRSSGPSARLRRTSRASSSSPRAFFSTSAASSRWWFQNDNKQRVDPLLSEEDRAPTVEEEQIHIHKKYLSPKHPIVFCHGLLGFDSVTIGPSIAPLEVTHWRGIKEVLQANGIEVLMTRVPATSSPIERARVLERKIEDTYAGRSGGLDCRYLASNLCAHTFHILSITTISTPHRGSSFADHFLDTVGPERFPSFLSLLDMLPNGGGDGSAFTCLTPSAMHKFNQHTPDLPSIKYFSWGATYTPGLIDTWKWPHSVILDKEGPNDGLVSVESAKWGIYLGTVQDASHLDLVGWVNTARYSWARLRGRDIKFHPATFYLAMADHLAREVDGVQPEPESIEEDPWDASSDRGDGDRRDTNTI